MIALEKDSNCEEDLEILVTRTLHLLGIPAHIKGHRYLREAIIMAIDDPKAVGLITKYIYPDIAKLFDTTPSRVNHAICHALDIAWCRGMNSSFMALIFPSKESKPTNSEFISELANFIKASTT
jgi:Sporulation initiation factor Spo0A C terminal.